MALRILNTMTRRKEELVPLQPGAVTIYSCGVTPYDLSHIGHARSAMVFDSVVRYLRWRGLAVRFVRNYTDVDDKIIRRANQEGVPAAEVSERYIRAFRDDMAALGVGPADVEPRATEHIPQMVALIERLVEKGLAYAVDGDVYFEVRRFAPYGRLSGKNLEELLAGARVEVDERKRDPRDFALWKATKPGEPTWPSPWGPGRPGWHIECSAMAMQYLGETLDIHGGGEDLIFPHHECEIAQSEGVTGVPFARLWMHNGMVNLGAEKMSKSLGNTLTIRSLVERHDPDAIRRYLLGTHYRNPLEFSEPRVAEYRRAMDRLRGLIGQASASADRAGERLATPGDAELSEAAVRATARRIADVELRARAEAAIEAFVAGMDDDFNTPQAVAALADLGSDVGRQRERAAVGPAEARDFVRAAEVLLHLGRVLGFFAQRADALERTVADRPEVTALLAERDDARRRRDWARADEIRARIAEMGFRVEDSAQGSRAVREP